MERLYANRSRLKYEPVKTEYATIQKMRGTKREQFFPSTVLGKVAYHTRRSTIDDGRPGRPHGLERVIREAFSLNRSYDRVPNQW
jgi:hypothetical protein